MQTKILQLCISFFLVALFSSCSSSKPQPPKKVQIPSWVKLQPNDTQEYTYGVGIGKNRGEALQLALSDVVSKLGIKVESSFTHKEIVDGYYSRSVSTSDIKSDIAKIRVTNYSVENTLRISYREYALLLKVDNKKFFSSLKADIERTKEDIISKLEKSNSKDPISRYNIKKELGYECDKLLSNVLVAYELNNSFDKNKYFNFVSNVKDEFYSEAKSLRFFVYGDKNSKNFVKVIQEQLIENGFNVVNINNKNIINIKLNSVDNINNKEKVITIKIGIKVTSGLKTIGSKFFVLKERFKSSKDRVYDTASIHFEQDIKKDGIDKILGIGTK